MLDLTFRVVLDDHLDRAQHRQRAGRVTVQIFADRVLEQRDVDDVLFCHTDPHRNREPPRACSRAGGCRRSSACVDRPSSTQTSARPARAACALTHHRVVQVQPSELDLAGARSERGLLADVIDHPVVKRPMVLELERAERVRDPFDRIRDRVVVGRINTPCLAGPMMRRVADAYSVGSRMLIFGEPMSIRARSMRAPSRNSPARIRRNRSRLSAAERLRCGLLRPGSVSVPRNSRGLVGGETVHVGEAVESAARQTCTSVQSNPTRSTADRPSRTPATGRPARSTRRTPASSLVGFVSSKRRLQTPANSSATPKLRQIDFAWPMCR